MKLKKYLSILMALALLAGLLPAAALAADPAPAEAGDWAGLEAAFAAGGSVVLTADVAAPQGASPLYVNEGVTVTLDLGGHVLDGTYAVEDDAACAIVVYGGDLTITDSGDGFGCITGGNFGLGIESGDARMDSGYITGQVLVAEEVADRYDIWGGSCVTLGGGSFTLSGTAELRDSYCGIQAHGESMVYMSGGEIRGHTALPVGEETYCGTGLELYESAAFEMTGGCISYNGWCGVVLWDNAEFEMLDGVIEGNADAGVVLYDSAEFATDELAEIRENKNGAILNDESCFYMVGGDVYENDECGVRVRDGEYVLQGGLIDYNGSADYAGADAGVIVEGGACKLWGGAIYENADYAIRLEGGELVLASVPELYLNQLGDIYLADGMTITVDEDLELYASATVAVQTPPAEGASVTLTSGLEASGAGVTSFVSAVPGYYVTKTAEGEAALAVSAPVGDWDALKAALAAGRGVTMTADIAAPEGAEMLRVPEGVSAALDLAGYSLECANVDAFTAICVEGALTLTDSDPDGLGYLDAYPSGDSETGAPLDAIYVAETGELRMTGGSILIENEGVEVEGGRFVMDGGIIGCAELGVCVCDGGVFNLAGGTIGFCDVGVEVHRDGEDEDQSVFWLSDGEVKLNASVGVRVLDGGFAYVSGGEISGNGFSSADPGDKGWADGVSISEGGDFTMSGGEIFGNKENGVYMSGGGFHMIDGMIYGNEGYISDDAELWYGGAGLLMLDGTGRMFGGEIYENVGGIVQDGGVFEMWGGCIRGHEGRTVEGEEGTLGGCGVQLSGTASFTLHSGEICDNLDGALVFDGLTLTYSGKPVFHDNSDTDIWLADGSLVRIDGELTVTEPISVGARPYPAAGQAVRVTTGLPGHGSVEQFTTTESDYKIDVDAAGEAVFAAPDYVVPTPYYDDGGSTPAPAKKDETKKDESASVTFTDVAETAWYAGAADFAAKNGLFEGIVAEGEEVPFYPEAEMTRGEAVLALWNLAGKPPMEGVMPFDDVTEGSFYAAAAGWAGNAEIVKGTDAGFDPDAPITREQFAAMVYRFVQLSGKGFTGMWAFRLDFPDAGEVSDWALEGVSWLVMNGILKGMDGELNPQGVLTRAQLAALLQRVAEALA